MYSGGEVGATNQREIKATLDENGNITRVYPDYTQPQKCSVSDIHQYDDRSIRVNEDGPYISEACTGNVRELSETDAQLLRDTTKAVKGAIAYFCGVDSMECKRSIQAPLSNPPILVLDCPTDSGRISFADTDGDGVFESMIIYIKAKGIASQDDDRETVIYAAMPTNAEMQELASSRMKNNTK